MTEDPRYQDFADIRHSNRDFHGFFLFLEAKYRFLSLITTQPLSISNNFQCIIHYHSTTQRCVFCIAAHSAYKQNKLIWMKKHCGIPKRTESFWNYMSFRLEWSLSTFYKRNIPVSIVTRLWPTEGSQLDSRQGRNFFCSHLNLDWIWHQHFIFCVDVQNPWSYTFIVLYVIRPAT